MIFDFLLICTVLAFGSYISSYIKNTASQMEGSAELPESCLAGL